MGGSQLILQGEYMQKNICKHKTIVYEDITYKCLCKSIQKHRIMTPRIHAERRFRTLFTRTQEFLQNLFKIKIKVYRRMNIILAFSAV